MGGAFRGRKLIAAVVGISALLPMGCGTSDGPGGGAAAGSGGGLGRLFSGSGGAAGSASTSSDQAKPELDCPPIDVRSGTAAYQLFQTGRDGARELRYQGIIGDTARECAAAGQTLTLKVGVEGRLLAGPAGTGAPISVPLRIAVVREGPTPKPIWSKLIRFPVQIPAGQVNTTFIHVEDGIAMPLPPPAELENYVIYVGFDPDAPEDKPQQKPRQRSRQGTPSG